MDVQRNEDFIIKDGRSKDATSERPKELQKKSCPSRHRQPGSTDSIRGPVGSCNMDRGKSYVPEIAQPPVEAFLSTFVFLYCLTLMIYL